MTTTTKQKKTPTHDIFDVQDREGRAAFWNKVGAAFENRDASHSVLIYQPGRPDSKTLQLRVIDRDKRPLKEGADPQRSPTHELFFVVESDDAPNEWRRVGVGFTNKDSSLSLVVDDGDRDGPKARFQMRTHKVAQLQKPQDTADGGPAEQPPAEPAAHDASAAEPPAAEPSASEQPTEHAERKPADPPTAMRPKTTVRKRSASAA